MVLRKAIVATAVGGIPEVITDEDTGLLVQPRNAQMLAERILYLVTHLHNADELVCRARRRVGHEYTTIQQAWRMHALYKVTWSKLPLNRTRFLWTLN